MTEKVSADLFLPEEKKAWFNHDRFGMFIHWGIYALAARHEWVKNREEIDDAHARSDRDAARLVLKAHAIMGIKHQNVGHLDLSAGDHRGLLPRHDRKR